MNSWQGEALIRPAADLAATPKKVGRPGGGKNNAPALDGWHSEEEAARRLGEDIITRRRKRRLGIGPQEWVREGRHVLYRDGCEERHQAEKLAARLAEAEAPRRGRPRRPRVAAGIEYAK